MSMYDKGIYYSMIKLDDALDKKSPFLFVKVYHKHKRVKKRSTMKPGRRKPHNNKNDDVLQSIKLLTDEFYNFKNEFNELRNDFQDFKKETRDNFIEVKEEIKGINNRLDYIVKANKLKDIPRKR